MYLTSLSLHNFRNFENVVRVDFPGKGILVAAAPNATGKTNFLESVIVLLRGKSFRAQIEECVKWGSEGFSVSGEVSRSSEVSEVSVHYQSMGRKMRIEEGGVPVSPVTFYSTYPFILFLPEDTFLFSRGPAQRRTFLNQVLVSSPAYLSSLVQFQRVLRQRNAALKTVTSPADIEAWTTLLIEHATPIWQQRQMLVDFVSTHLEDTYEALMGERISFEAKLVASVDDIEMYEQELASSWSYEKKYQYTMHGPHRDDLEITVDRRPVKSVLSRGQTRGLIISLKIVMHKLLKQMTGEEPILLLDEVLSELDDDRQEKLLTSLPDTQVLLTCTKVPEILRERESTHLLDLRAILTPEEEEEQSEVEDEKEPVVV